MTIEIEKQKLSEFVAPKRKLFIETLKAGILYRDLLDDFERDMITEIGNRYRQFGGKLAVAQKQIDQIVKIADKLNL